MIRKTLQWILCALGLLLAACGHADSFEVDGQIADGSTINVYLRYYTGSEVKQGVTPADQGKFSFRASTPQPTIVELLDNEDKILGRAYVANGDKLTINIDRANPYRTSVKGTADNEAWSAFLNAHADTLRLNRADLTNTLVERYSAEHPDEMVPVLLFTTLYDASLDPHRADSVMRSLSAEPHAQALLLPMSTALARLTEADFTAPVRSIAYRSLDSASVFKPTKAATVLAFCNSNYYGAERDSLVYAMRQAEKNKRLAVCEIMFAPDSLTWRSRTRLDSLEHQGWVPAGVYSADIDILAIPRLPYFIVLDSAGVQTLRTAEFARAAAVADSLSKPKKPQSK